MKARNIILTITAAALIAAPGVLLAQQGPGDCDGSGPHGPRGGDGFFGSHGGPGFLRMLPRLAAHLELTEEQQTQIEAIVDAAQTEIEPLREQAQTERETFREGHEPGDFDEATFRAHFETQAQLHVEMQLIGSEMKSSVFNVLTPEQQAELLELRELFGDRGGRGAGKRGGGAKRHGFH